MLLRAELAAKDERLDLLLEERERERRQLSERISEIRDQLARSEEERREKDRQLTALLTDQQKKTEPNLWAAIPGDEHLPTQIGFRRLMPFFRRTR